MRPDRSTSISTSSKLFTPLNTAEIEALLDDYDWHVTVAPFNCVPSTAMKSYPCAYICNTDDNQSPGTHWFALLFTTKDTVEIFDSFGKTHHPEMREKFPSHITVTQANTQALQHPLTATCGYYCIMFLHHRLNLAWSMDEFIALFSSTDHLGNDIKVVKMI